MGTRCAGHARTSGAGVVTTGDDERHEPLVSESRGFIQANQQPPSASEHGHASRTGLGGRLLHRGHNKCEVRSDFRVGMRGITQGSEAHANKRVLIDGRITPVRVNEFAVRSPGEVPREPTVRSDEALVSATHAGDQLVRQERRCLASVHLANRQVGQTEVLVGGVSPVRRCHPASDDCAQPGEQGPDGDSRSVAISGACFVHEAEEYLVVAGADGVDGRRDIGSPSCQASDREPEAACGSSWDRRCDSNGAWLHVRTVHPGRPGLRPWSTATYIEAQLTWGVGR